MKETDPISRSEFFSRFRNTLQPQHQAQQSEQPNGVEDFLNQTLKSSHTRRPVLKAAAVIAVSAVIPNNGQNNRQESQNHENPNPSADNNSAIKSEDSQELEANQQKENRSLETMVQAVALGAVETAIVSAAKSQELPVEKFLTQPQINLMTRDYDRKATAFQLGLSPWVTEGIYRYLPSRIFAGESEGIRWEFGLPVSIAYGALSTIEPRTDYSKFSEKMKNINSPNQIRELLDAEKELVKQIFQNFHYNGKIPIFTFVNSLFLWDKVRRDGYSGAVLARAMINGTMFALGRTLNQFKSEETGSQK